jgi:hypothetical protein
VLFQFWVTLIVMESVVEETTLIAPSGKFVRAPLMSTIVMAAFSQEVGAGLIVSLRVGASVTTTGI